MSAVPAPHPAPAEDWAAALPGSQLGLFNGPGLLMQGALLGAGVWSGRPLLVLCCALLLASAAVAWAWAALAPLALQCRCSLGAGRGFPGDRVRLSITLDNRKPLALGWTRADLGVPAELAPPGAPADRPWLGRVGFGASLGGFERVTWQGELLCRRRGYYRLGPAQWLCGDGFGLYLNERRSQPHLSLLVYPRLYEMADLGLPTRHPLGEARDPALLFEDASRPRGLRDYTAETPFKKIAWGASARSGRLQAKVFEPTASVQATLFLAVDRFAPDGDPALFELAVSTAASLAHRLIAQRQPVGLLCNGALAGGADHAAGPASGPVVLGAGRGEGQLESLLASLARVGREPLVSFEALLEARADSLPGGSTLCVIAARLGDADMQRLALLRRRGCGVMVLMVGDAPLPLPDQGRLACRRISRADLRPLRA